MPLAYATLAHALTLAAQLPTPLAPLPCPASPEGSSTTSAGRKPKHFNLNPSLSDSDKLGIQVEIFPADKFSLIWNACVWGDWKVIGHVFSK